jgi:hypothetical protein
MYHIGLRVCTSILVNLVLALTFLQAPLQHVHEHESTENHPHSFIHTHFSHRSLSDLGKIELRNFDPDDDAQFRDWFSATVDDHFNFPPTFLVALPYAFAPAWSGEPFAERLILSGHDPPELACSTPRGPPA